MNPALLLSDDFLFISRVQGHARAVGFEVKSARTAEALQSLANEAPPSCVILDVHVAGAKLADLVAALKALSPPPRIVAYGSHVAAEALAQARDAGCDLVMPNSLFVERLATDLPAWIAGSSES